MIRAISASERLKSKMSVVVSVIAHAVVHLAPGEPSEVDPSNPRMKPEDVALIRAAFHLDEPLHVQYVYWMRDLLSGELRSFKDGEPAEPKPTTTLLRSGGGACWTAAPRCSPTP